MQSNSSVLTKIASPFPYVMISGSYEDDVENDRLCELLGLRLSELGVGIISGGNAPGKKVSLRFYTSLLAKSKYDPDKIITYYRLKENEKRRMVDAVGSVKFFGSTATEMRKEMILKARAVIVVGGNLGTKEEVHIATVNDISVIPVANSGGFAAFIHNRYKTNFYSQFTNTEKYDTEVFEALKSDDLDIATDAVIVLLKNLILSPTTNV